MGERLFTGISKLYWCSLHDDVAKYEPAQIAIGSSDEFQEFSWLDKLFEDGLYLPDDVSKGEGRPLTILIAGPPGSGKTTLAIETCYRLANWDPRQNREGLYSLYISTDAESNRVIENAESFGWEKVSNYIVAYEKKQGKDVPKSPMVVVYGQEQAGEWDSISELIGSALKDVTTWLLKLGESTIGVPLGAETLSKLVPWVVDRMKQDVVKPARVKPDVLVVDNLNIVKPDDQQKLFERFLSVTSDATKMAIFILDSNPEGQSHKPWEYFCDIVIRMDYSLEEDNYFVRTIEVVKARYQSHIWGTHQLKIYPSSKIEDPPKANEPEARQHYNTRLKRAHPYHTEGGIFIYPSIHYYLSKYKRLSPVQEPAQIDTQPQTLNEIVHLPSGRCTAFIGQRGGHKSHLGYYHLLHRLMEHEECGLVISLRDDEEMTRRTMKRVLKDQFEHIGDDADAEKELYDIERDNRLEILYYPPGYITPEEFFHRIFVSVHRLKHRFPGETSKLTVLFNSLDQISARFPLCTKQEIFIPGIISFLTGEDVTSIFIAVDEPGQPDKQYGLLPMADLILSFNRQQIPYEDYCSYLNKAPESWDDITPLSMEEMEQSRENSIKTYDERVFDTHRLYKGTLRDVVILKVERAAGGQKAGANGILELVDEGQLELYQKHGLHFTRINLLSEKHEPDIEC